MKLLFDPALYLFGGHLEAMVFFGGMFIYVFLLCLPAYVEEKDIEKKRDTLAAWVILDSMFAVGIGIAAF